MAFLRTFVQSSSLVALSAAMLQAQAARSHVIAAPAGRPRIAMIAPPPPPPQAYPAYQYGETVFSNSPVIVTPDGRVLVNLGYGYEQVSRTCPYAYGYGCQSYGYPIAPQTPIMGGFGGYGYGYGYGPPTYVPPTYAPPAYGAPTYPVPGGYGGYRPYPSPRQPSAPRGNGCPAGYVPTGGYPPCVDPYRAPVQSMGSPTSGSPTTLHASPRRGATYTAPGASFPGGVRRR